MKLTRDNSELIQNAMDILHKGIDVGKRTVEAEHQFEHKLLAFQNLLAMQEDYPEEEATFSLFDVIEILEELGNELAALEKGEVHIVLEEEAVAKKGPRWVVKHRKKIENEVRKEKIVSKKIIKKIHLAFVKVKEILDTESENEEVRQIMENLLAFFNTYEEIFKNVLTELK